MKKILGLTYGGLQKKLVRLVLAIVIATVGLFALAALWQSRMLTSIVEETRVEQQEAISRTSDEIMSAMLEKSFVQSSGLYASLADNDFSEIVKNVYMLQSMAEGLLQNGGTLAPAELELPDLSQDGTASAMVSCEDGVDYTQSEYLGLIAHLKNPMIAMVANSDKINACYIGLADGTHYAVDLNTVDKYDENGELIPFPVRERPWYRGAVEAGKLYLTGIETDAFSGELTITCSIPLKVNGKIVGVAGADIFLDNMDDFVESSSEKEGYRFVINQEGQVILAPKNNELFSAEMASQATDLRESSNRELAAFVAETLLRPTKLTTVSIDGTDYYMAGAPMPSVGWAVISVIRRDITEMPEQQMLTEYDEINDAATGTFRSKGARTMRTLLLLILLVAGLSVAAALAESRRIVKPIEEMTKDIYASGSTGEPFGMKDIYRTDDEIELLAESFAELSWKVRQYIRDITEITKEKERVSTELHMANRIQASMLPSVFPAYPERGEFDIYASMDPAREVGGDFYDFFLIDNDHLCIVMADVSGKGVPAALFMMISKVILQSCAMLGKSAAEILTKTNEAICSSNPEEMFVTVWLGILEISTGRLTAANAGHEYPAMLKDGRFCLMKDRHGLVIGGMPTVRYKEYEIQMEPGDKLFVYTDGVPEATNDEGEMFGLEEMLTALNREPQGTTDQILKNVRMAVDDFADGAEQFDDITMLCLEYRGTGNENPPETV
jgi:sigma-B regulation protein RsbU (phosphoserine phosphatase)